MSNSVEKTRIIDDEVERSELWPIAQCAVAKALPPMVSYAQNFEDVTLRRALQDISHGFYIDIGAWHPLDDSVTASFYENGWHGINVEPNAQYYDELTRLRLRDTNLRCVVGATNGTCLFTVVENTGLSSGASGNADVWLHPAASKRQIITVPCVRLDELFLLTEDKVVDFLKIDAEGMETDIITAASFEKYRPRVIVVEALQPLTQIPNHHDWEGHLLSRGYDFVLFDGLNRFYLREEDSWRRAMFAVPPCVFDNFRGPTLAAALKPLQAAVVQTEEQHQAALCRESVANTQLSEVTIQLSELRAALEHWERRYSDLQQRHILDQQAQDAKSAEMKQALNDQQRLIKDHDAIVTELQLVSSSRDAMIAAREELVTSLEYTQSELSRVIGERDAALLEREKLAADVTAAAVKLTTASASHDSATKGRDEALDEVRKTAEQMAVVKTEYDRIASDLRHAVAQHERTEAMLADTSAELDRALLEGRHSASDRDAAIVECRRLQTERDRLIVDRDSLDIQNKSMLRIHQRVVAERDSLTGATTELDRVKTELQESISEAEQTAATLAATVQRLERLTEAQNQALGERDSEARTRARYAADNKALVSELYRLVRYQLDYEAWAEGRSILSKAVFLLRKKGRPKR